MTIDLPLRAPRFMILRYGKTSVVPGAGVAGTLRSSVWDWVQG